MTIKEFSSLELVPLPSTLGTWQRQSWTWKRPRLPFGKGCPSVAWPQEVNLCTLGPYDVGYDTQIREFIVNSLYYKRSIGSDISENIRKRVRAAVVTGDWQRYRKPKKPVWYPHVFRQSKPSLRKPYDSISEPSVEAIAFLWKSLHPWNGRALENQSAREKSLARYESIAAGVASVVYQSYVRRVKLYERKKQLFEVREARRFEAFSKRREKYEARMLKYEKSVKSAEKRVLRLLPSSFFRASQNEYFECNMRSAGSFTRVWTMWDSAPSDPLNFVLSKDLLVNFDKETLTTAQRDAVLSNFVQGIGRRLGSAAAAKDFGLSKKLYGKIGDQKLHVGNLIGEGLQTLNLLATTWLRLAKLVMLKKTLFKEVLAVASDPKKISNEILQWKFGAEPLIRDLSELVQDVIDGAIEDNMSLQFKVARTGQLVSLGSDGVSFTGQLDLSYTANYLVDHAYVRKLGQYGLIDPSQVAWELTPWSFVFDWLLPIGQWIASFTSDYGLEFTGLTRSAKYVGRFEVSECMSLASDGFPFTGSSLGLTGSFEGVLRCREVNLPLPNKDYIIRPKNPYSLSHVIEAIALLVQRLR